MKKIFFAIGMVVLMGSCYNDKYDKLYPTPTVTVNTCDTTTISCATDILPIFVANCSVNNSSCHSAASSSGVDLSTWNAIMKGYATNGTLIKDINFGMGNNMPKGGTQLSACDINKITRWAHLGGINN